jgi:diguanylate cyclase (GGDEF)-like protein
MIGSQASGQSGRTVLVVGDPEITHILAVNLVHANFQTISAQNGAEALNKAAKERPHLILVDVVLPDLDGVEVCRQLKESPSTSQIPVVIISAKAESEDRIAGIAAGAEACVTKPFVPEQVVALVESCLRRLEGNWNSDPLTGLPNHAQIDNRITGLLRQNEIFAAIYIDIDYFKAFNHVYGFRQGDYAIQLLAEITREAVRLLGNPDDSVGHLGGDDFVVITTPSKARILCQRIISEFDNRIRVLYTPSDLQRGYIECEGRIGQRQQYPIMSLSLAVVTNEKRTFNNHFQVSEVAAELRDYLRPLSGSNYCFDRREYSNTAPTCLAPKGVAAEHREELKVTQGMLAWINFLTSEMESPVRGIKDCLNSLMKNQEANSAPEQPNSLEAMQENANHLLRIFGELEHLKKRELNTGRISLEEVDLGKTFGWIMTEVQALAEQRGTEINIDGVENISPLIADGASLAQALFYLLRSEIKSSAPGDQIQLRTSEVNESFVTVEIINRLRFIPPSELATLFRGDPESLASRGRRNDLYLAQVLVHGFGGKLKVKSRKGEGTVFTIFVPKRWQSSVEEVEHMQSELEKKGRTGRLQVERIRHRLSSTMEQVPSDIEEGLESFGAMLQELEMLCNRSLFLVDDLSCEVESTQERLLEQEAERLAISEAVLTISREIVQLAQVKHLFDPECAKRVAKNALAVADELKLSRSDQQILYCAALLKDLGLVSVPRQVLDPRLTPSLEKVSSLRGHFDAVRKALSQLNCLAPALSLARQRYERYNGSTYPLIPKDNKIPVGAEILAIVDIFDAMTSGMYGQTLEPEAAAKQLAADSGRRFDPEVVSAFLQVWRRKGLQMASGKPILEVWSS